MMELITGGFVLGILGSMHCVGMCGPIALSLPVVNESPASRYIGTFLYNIGRVLTYATLGLFFGMIGQTVVMIGFQQWLSVFLGVALLLYLFVPGKYKDKVQILPGFMSGVRKRIGILFQTKSYGALFGIGLLNGFLPCGLVYVAVAAAVAQASMIESSLFMAAFGFGTLPMMWLVAVAGTGLKLQFRTRIKKIYPVVIGVMGCLLIVRGLGMGIPYLSPSMKINKSQQSVMIQCHDEK
jgi:sulfite exporter TauE/SafE